MIFGLMQVRLTKYALPSSPTRGLPTMQVRLIKFA